MISSVGYGAAQLDLLAVELAFHRERHRWVGDDCFLEGLDVSTNLRGIVLPTGLDLRQERLYSCSEVGVQVDRGVGFRVAGVRGPLLHQLVVEGDQRGLVLGPVLDGALGDRGGLLFRVLRPRRELVEAAVGHEARLGDRAGDVGLAEDVVAALDELELRPWDGSLQSVVHVAG